MYSERQAKMHPNRSGSVDCKNLGFAMVVLQCDRKHFGCPHCSQYFRDPEPFLAHLTRECRPGKAPRRAHQSLQIRALLQQPGVISNVRKYCLQLRGQPEAYKKLWWAWDKSAMADIIERLEYGVQQQVDLQTPGIALENLSGFLHDLLAPSTKSIFEADIRQGCSVQALSGAEDKPLPPLPREALNPPVGVPYDPGSIFQQTRSYLQPNHQHILAAADPYESTTAAEWRAKQRQHHDPMIGGSSSDQLYDGFQAFEWDHLADDINIIKSSADPSLDGKGFEYG